MRVNSAEGTKEWYFCVPGTVFADANILISKTSIKTLIWITFVEVMVNCVSAWAVKGWKFKPLYTENLSYQRRSLRGIKRGSLGQ